MIDPRAAPRWKTCCRRPCCSSPAARRRELDGLEAQKLRDYIDRGGFLFAEACCVDGSGFDAGLAGSFSTACSPKASTSSAALGPSTPLWRIDELVRPDSPYVGRLWTVEYGCRTCVVLLRSRPVVLLGTLQAEPHAECPDGAQQRIDDAAADRPQRAGLRHQPRTARARSNSFAAVDAAESSNALAPRGVMRSRQADPRRRLQRRAGRAGESAPHRVAGRAEAADQHQAIRPAGASDPKPRQLPARLHARPARLPLHRPPSGHSCASI